MKAARRADALGLRQNRWWAVVSRVGKRLVWDSAPQLAQAFCEIRFHGARLRIPYSLTRDYISKLFEPETGKVISTVLQRGGRVVDVGANIGALTCLVASAVGPDGRVWAIEPDPRNLEFLYNNLEINGHAQVEVIEAAAGDETGTARLYRGGTGVMSSLLPDESVDSLQVPMVTLDSLRIPGPIDLLKIDVEGVELLVLKGAIETMARSSRLVLLIEWNPSKLTKAGFKPLDLPVWLMDAGFQLRILDGGGGDSSIEAAVQRVRQRRTPAKWYCNLLGSRTPLPRSSAARRGTDASSPASGFPPCNA